MNKKVLIGIVAVVLIVALAIVVGRNLAKPNSENANTNSNGASTNGETPSIEATETPEIELTPTPEETPTPIETPSPEHGSSNVDVTKLSSKEKKEYAISIAKKEWNKLDADVKVYYKSETKDEKIYSISVRDASTTEALIWYKVNISTGTCEEM